MKRSRLRILCQQHNLSQHINQPPLPPHPQPVPRLRRNRCLPQRRLSRSNQP
jgi:hypothetical protein